MTNSGFVKTTNYIYISKGVNQNLENDVISNEDYNVDSQRTWCSFSIGNMLKVSIILRF